MAPCNVFDPNCEGCRPAVIDPSTGKKLPDDHPTMKIVNAVWDATPRVEQEACFRIWVKNSRAPMDLRLAEAFFARVRARLARLEAS